MLIPYPCHVCRCPSFTISLSITPPLDTVAMIDDYPCDYVKTKRYFIVKTNENEKSEHSIVQETKIHQDSKKP